EIRLGLTSEDADGGTGASSPTEASEEEDSATRNSATHGRPPPRPGTTPVSWPIERLQAEWLSLTTPEKIRVARLGKRPARAMIMRMQDKILHAFLLRNPKMGIDEIATMAGMVQLDPTLLRQIAMTQEWIRHTGVARNLVAHPKLPIPLIKKIMPHLSVDELRRLTRSGRVRASVKRLLMKRVERGR
ncbi:MAG: hypothetical protein KAI47_14270, partial [Deltaproteobacteria bacterium]|nr:hypothetical protein [Deltaproteobacteria bacterium]